MLHLIPPPLHRTALRLAHRLRRLWWRTARPKVTGVRVLAIDASDRVLLVRHSYGSTRWMAPGGGMRRGEDAIAAAVRELAEEAGCALAGALVIDVVEEDLSGACNVLHIVCGRIEGHVRGDGREIVAAGFFAAHALPEDMPPHLRGALPGWLDRARDAGV